MGEWDRGYEQESEQRRLDWIAHEGNRKDRKIEKRKKVFICPQSATAPVSDEYRSGWDQVFGKKRHAR